MEYKFSMDFWNKDHIRNFNRIRNYFFYEDEHLYIPGFLSFLEIGVFEGRTSTWLLDNILLNDEDGSSDCLTLIDPDVGPNFNYNMQKWLIEGELTEEGKKRINFIKDYSYNALPKLKTENKLFDLIYIDGDHNACGVLEDAVMAWKLLKENGILLFDDYLMEVKDSWFYISHKEFNQHHSLVWQHPRNAIDCFLNIYKGQYEIIIDNYQIGIRKVCDLGAKNLNHGDNTQKAIYEV